MIYIGKYLFHFNEADVKEEGSHVKEPGYYFSDETEQLQGPYDSAELASAAMTAYAETL